MIIVGRNIQDDVQTSVQGYLARKTQQERGRIARELHDGIGQSLSAIKFKIEDALGQMGKDVAEPSVNSLNNLIPLIQSTVEEVRRITMDLRPSTLDEPKSRISRIFLNFLKILFFTQK